MTFQIILKKRLKKRLNYMVYALIEKMFIILLNYSQILEIIKGYKIGLIRLMN